MAKTPLKILLDTYWTSQGWRGREDRFVSDEDRKIAEDAGYMFPSETWNHDQAVANALEAVSMVERSTVVSTYLIGLGGKDLALRSALASYANGLPLKKHRSAGRHGCDICGAYPKDEVDFNVLSFERHKFGGVRHTQPVFIAFDLREFAKGKVEGDTESGVAALRNVLQALEALPSEARASDAEKAIKGIVAGNSDARRAVIETLGYCGVLRQKGTQAVWQHWYGVFDREPPLKPSKNDWSFPANWWRGVDGVDWDMAVHWFGEFGLT